MKYFLVIPAMMASLAGAAIAQEAKPAADKAVAVDGAYYTATEQSDFYASSLIGARVYTTTAEVDSSKAVDKASTDWTDIGEINNIVVARDGAVRAVVLGVGGFLGIGEKNVAVNMKQLRFVKKAGDKASDYFVVVNLDKASLEKAPTYKPVL